MGCWCVKPDKLANAIYRIRDCEWKLDNQKSECDRREMAILGNYELRIKLTRDFCQEQVQIVQAGCSDKLKVVVDQGTELVSQVTTTYNEKVKSLAEVKAPRTPLYKHPALWAILGLVVGGGVGIGVGALIWK